MVVVPWPTAVARPDELIDAMVGLAVLQTTELDTFCVLPSLKVPMADKLRDCPIPRVGLKGVTWIAVSEGPPPPPEPVFILKAARASAQGKVGFVSVRVPEPLTAVPERLAT